jgi:hypothetical protein
MLSGGCKTARFGQQMQRRHATTRRQPTADELWQAAPAWQTSATRASACSACRCRCRPTGRASLRERQALRWHARPSRRHAGDQRATHSGGGNAIAGRAAALRVVARLRRHWRRLVRGGKLRHGRRRLERKRAADRSHCCVAEKSSAHCGLTLGVAESAGKARRETPVRGVLQPAALAIDAAPLLFEAPESKRDDLPAWSAASALSVCLGRSSISGAVVGKRNLRRQIKHAQFTQLLVGDPHRRVELQCASKRANGSGARIAKTQQTTPKKIS